MPFKKGHKIRSKRSLGSAATTPAKRRREDDIEDTTEGDIDPLQGDDPATPAQDVEDGDEDNEAENDEDDEEDEDGVRPKASAKRKRGRVSRRSVAADDLLPDDVEDEDASDVGTPRRRKIKAAPKGVRGRKRFTQTDTPQVVVNGEVLDIVNDEAVVDEDPDGNEKVDENGVLQGGREYRVRTFKIIDREDRLYMLSTEPARCCGFRDSYLFFTKHPKLHKILLTEPEKLDLISRDILPNSYKGRNIGVVTARSVFREFGARIIVAGKRITDDYKVAEAKAEGVEEGVLADPEDRVPGGQEGYNRNRYVAWFGASDVYRTQGASQGQDKKGMAMKRRNNVSIVNWQSLHSKEASRFNTSLVATRRSTHAGVYDNNTNNLFYPSITQPTHARWEYLPGEDKSITNGDQDTTIFQPVPDIIARNFAVIDTTFEAPAISASGHPGPDGSIGDMTSGSNGLSNIPAELLDELPEDCRKALLEARATEQSWKQRWSTEHHSAQRGALKVGFIGYPV